MQNRYVGDTGDFGKYGLLKTLCTGGLRLGVNWYLNPNPEKHKDDGKHTKYPPTFYKADSELCEQLQSIIRSKKRKISEIERKKILPAETLFYKIPFPKNCYDRDEWFEKGLSHLSNSDIIFCDPDNGLEVATWSKYHPEKAVKYIYFDEVKEMFRQGKSLVIYQHAKRNVSTSKQAKERRRQLSKILRVNPDEQIKTVYFNTGTARFFLIIQQRAHKKVIDSNLSALINSPWRNIFELK